MDGKPVRPPRSRMPLPAVLAAACVVLCLPRFAAAGDVFADAVEAFQPGKNGGNGEDRPPDVVLGPPHGGGTTQGSLDVLSLGIGGSIVLRFDLPVICDSRGADFTVFENAFHSGSPAGPLFAEYGYVAVSQDGATFVEFPYDPVTGAGLAGRTPVQSSPESGIDPADPAVSGGDSFDLAAVGLRWAKYVRITDVAGKIADLGDMPQFTVAPNAGFDLDAVVAVHACDPAAEPSPAPTPTPTPSPEPTEPLLTPTATTAVTAPGGTPTATHGTPVATRTATAPSTPSATPTVTATAQFTPTSEGPVRGDLDGDGRVTLQDASILVAELFAANADHRPGADVNRDGRVSAADLVAWAALVE